MNGGSFIDYIGKYCLYNAQNDRTRQNCPEKSLNIQDIIQNSISLVSGRDSLQWLGQLRVDIGVKFFFDRGGFCLEGGDMEERVAFICQR